METDPCIHTVKTKHPKFVLALSRPAIESGNLNVSHDDSL